MNKLLIKNINGEQVGEQDIADNIFDLNKGSQAVHDSVVAYLAHKRQGTASTLTKGEVAGSNKKPWRQKGTGRARAGYRQSPLWRGGGVTFGPKPRKYNKFINKEVKKLAFKRAFGEKFHEGRVELIDSLELSEPKTRVLANILKNWTKDGKVLLITDKISNNLALAARNMQELKVTNANIVNTYQLLRYHWILITREAFESLKMRLELV